MAQVIRLPAMGQTMEEGTILRWLKQEGDRVEPGEPLAEIMTDKVNMEMEAPEGGTVLKLLHPADATVDVHAPICILGEPGEKIATLIAELDAPGASTLSIRDSPARHDAPASDAVPASVPDSNGRPASSPRARRAAEEHGIDLASLLGKGTGPRGRIQEADVLAFLEHAEAPVRISPLAQRIADDAGIEPRELVGSGPGGKIRKEDVLKATEPTQAALPIPVGILPTSANAESERIPLTPLRRRIADHVSQSARTAPHVTLAAEIDVTELVRLRTALVVDVEKRYGVRLTYTDLLVRAACVALGDHPRLNSSLDGDHLIQYRDVHMGVAVAIPDGLIVPVVRNAGRKTIPEISREIKDLAGRARENRLKPDDLAGGTFTVTNLGGYGIDSFTPIINAPQCAILGIGRIVERPAFGAGHQIEARSFMTLCLSFDHRIIDGAPAAEFMRTLRESLESPYRILV